MWDDDNGHSDVFSPHYENFYLIDIGAGAGELEQRYRVTEKVVDGISITESQSQYAPSVDHGIRKCNHVGTKYKIGTHFRRHGSVIQK
jgi:hypothetical protein